MRKQRWIARLLIGVLILAGGSVYTTPMQGEEVKLWDDWWETSDFLETRIDGSTATIPMMKAVRGLISNWEDVEHSTTPVAYERLCKGEVDLILVTPPAAEDLAIAKAAGMELEVVPIAREALVFLNNTENPVTSLTRDQLRDIYMGRITNWREVGGNDAQILPYQRETRSGSQTLFLDCLMRGQVPMEPEKDLVSDSMGRLIDQVSSFDDAQYSLGYSVFYYANRMYLSDTVRVLAVDGVAPNVRTIEDGTYPLCTGYFAVLRKDAPMDSLARQLVDWMLTDEGQALLSKAGYGRLREEENPALVAYDWSSTHVSSGTGGTLPRQHKVFPEFGWQERTVPEDVVAMAREWDAQVGKELADLPVIKDELFKGPTKKPEEKSDEEREAVFRMRLEKDAVSTALLNLYRVMELDEVNYETYAIRTAVIDMEQRRFLKLSDLFYDGVNYIDYINKHLVTAPKFSNVEDSTLSPYIEWGKQVFSGLPADYPYFLWYGDHHIEILYDSANPFWERQDDGVWPLRVFVPLGHWVSPWGGCVVNTVYHEQTLPGDTQFILPALRIDEGREPEAEARINAALAARSEELIRDQARWQENKDQFVTVWTSCIDRFALVTYWLEENAAEGFRSVRPLSAQLFNLHTGEGAELGEIYAQWKDSPPARYFEKFGWYYSEDDAQLLKDYLPPEKIEITYANVTRYEGELTLYLQFDRADGEEISMLLPLAALGW